MRSEPPSNRLAYQFSGPPRSTPQTAAQSLHALFYTATRQNVHWLHWDDPYPLPKLPLPVEGATFKPDIDLPWGHTTQTASRSVNHRVYTIHY